MGVIGIRIVFKRDEVCVDKGADLIAKRGDIGWNAKIHDFALQSRNKVAAINGDDCAGHIG